MGLNETQWLELVPRPTGTGHWLSPPAPQKKSALKIWYRYCCASKGYATDSAS